MSQQSWVVLVWILDSNFLILLQASTEDIRNAYKVLSKRFHPDKHSDPTLKLAAESMFNRLKKVYDGEFAMMLI